MRFVVRGLPAPQGSKRAIVNRYTHRAAIIEDSKRVRPWRADVREAALDTLEATSELPPEGPVHVSLEFRLPRPKGHYGTGRNADQLKPGAPEWPAGKPDIDKLTRAVLDAITGIILADDAQVVSLDASKRYVVRGVEPAWVAAPGCEVIVTALA